MEAEQYGTLHFLNITTLVSLFFKLDLYYFDFLSNNETSGKIRLRRDIFCAEDVVFLAGVRVDAELSHSISDTQLGIVLFP